jgi:hypothetical protein
LYLEEGVKEAKKNSKSLRGGRNAGEKHVQYVVVKVRFER